MFIAGSTAADVRGRRRARGRRGGQPRAVDRAAGSRGSRSFFSDELRQPRRATRPAGPVRPGLRRGLTGEGLGASRQKWSGLPEAHNDFIFAVIGEELGLLGTVLVIALFAILAVAMVRVIRRHADPFVQIATAGIAAWILGQALVNIAVVIGLLPVVGLPAAPGLRRGFGADHHARGTRGGGVVRAQRARCRRGPSRQARGGATVAGGDRPGPRGGPDGTDAAAEGGRPWLRC